MRQDLKVGDRLKLRYATEKDTEAPHVITGTVFAAEADGSFGVIYDGLPPDPKTGRRQRGQKFHYAASNREGFERQIWGGKR